MDIRDKRIEFNMEVDISDGNLVCKGLLSNISRKGIMISDVPQKFNFYAPKWVAIIDGTEKNFKLPIKPRWSRIQGKCKDVGFRIISPSLTWVKFINELDGKEVALAPTFH